VDTLQVSIVAAAAAAAAAGGREESARVPYQRPFTCVRLQGLPYDVEMEEVVELLVCIARVNICAAAAAATTTVQRQQGCCSDTAVCTACT
jgi:hypothetical protein